VGYVVRRGQQNRRALRQASKATLEQFESPHGAYTPPDRAQCRNRQWDAPVDDLSTIRLQFNIWRLDGRLVNFVINVQVLTAEGWVSVERFDCCHGHCHLHPDSDEDDSESIHRLDGLDDVEQAFREVERSADERARIIRDKERDRR
jgi:hypothetical protein